MSDNVTDFGLIAPLAKPVDEATAETIQNETSLEISYDGSVVMQRHSGDEAGATLLNAGSMIPFSDHSSGV